MPQVEVRPAGQIQQRNLTALMSEIGGLLERFEKSVSFSVEIGDRLHGAEPRPVDGIQKDVPPGATLTQVNMLRNRLDVLLGKLECNLGRINDGI